MTLTRHTATRAAAAVLALASFAVAGCGSSSKSASSSAWVTTVTTRTDCGMEATYEDFEKCLKNATQTLTVAASPTLITHTSRVPKVVSPDPVPVEVPVKYNGQMAVRYAAWVDAREWCDTSGRGDSCARLADEKFADVAYNVRAREEYLKRGTYETRWSTPPAATSYSTTTSVETVRPTRPGSAPSNGGGKFAGMTPVLVGSGVGVLALIALALAFLTRRRRGYRPAHTTSYGGGERSYGNGYRFDDDLNTDFGDDADDY